MHSAFAQLDHRPWPVPQRRWQWRQSWRDLAFLHWPVAAESLEGMLPAGLKLQRFDGQAWLGIVPFRMAGVMRRPLPDVPGISAFPELNVRTYVDVAEGPSRPGVWFLSLDATSKLAVWAARKYFYLPYFHADITIDAAPSYYDYTSVRRDGRARFAARYEPTSEVYAAAPGTLEHWLTERYCLYAVAPNGELLRNEVHHGPWPLQTAEVLIEECALTSAYGLDIAGPPAWVHFAKRIDVVVWSADSANVRQ